LFYVFYYSCILFILQLQVYKSIIGSKHSKLKSPEEKYDHNLLKRLGLILPTSLAQIVIIYVIVDNAALYLNQLQSEKPSWRQNL
jgi:hypothetical protein